jgi:hypothetical protein
VEDNVIQRLQLLGKEWGIFVDDSRHYEWWSWILQNGTTARDYSLIQVKQHDHSNFQHLTFLTTSDKKYISYNSE